MMKCLFFVLAVFCIVTQFCVEAQRISCNGRSFPNKYVCCQKRPNFVGRPGGVCCGTRGFHPSSQVCCGGKVFRKKNVNTGCCYGQYYQRGKMLCCGRKLIDIKTHGCCRNEPFIKAYEDCCDGERVPNFSVNSTTPQQCCGKVLHDVTTHQCCAEKVAPKVAGTHTKCCQETTYDSRRESCCNREIIMKESGKDECCHGRMIDSSRKICCDYKIQNKIYGEDTGCCRLALYKYTLYNMRKKICCSRELRDRKPRGQPFNEKVAKRFSCCNQAAYDTKHEICCGLRVHPRTRGKDERCCSSRPYDRSKYICCEGRKWKLRRPRYEFCCGRYRYDRRSHQCKLVAGKYKRVSLSDVARPKVTENTKGIDIFLGKVTTPFIDPFASLITTPAKPTRRRTRTTTTPNPFVNPFLFFTQKRPITLPTRPPKKPSGILPPAPEDMPEWLKGIDWSSLDKKDSPFG